jgi:GTP pyrophosphokinase
MDSEILKQNLLSRCPDQFKDQLQKAISIAQKEFGSKKRPEGDLYITHSLDTALRLQKNDFDTATVIAALLHHLNTDQLENIKNEVPEEILEIVKTYSHVDQIVKNTDAPFTTVTKYILNSADDLRPVIIQIFNAQSNSHILDSIENNEERKEMIKRNLNIYANLAEYLGFDKIKTDITEEAFRITQRQDYDYIEKLYKKTNTNEEKLKKYDKYIKNLLGENLKEVKIESRIKSKYSTFNKLKKYIKEGYKDPIYQITDLIGFRIITQKRQTCFDILDAIWEKGDIVIEKFDDYISRPKPNGYKAIQGPVIFPDIDSMMIEIQILTQKMHENNTYGPASHIAYKESKKRFAKTSNKYKWIKEVHEAIKNNQENSDSKFSIPIKVKIFPDEVYAITPKGRIINLNKGDTITDFAYTIHTDIGNSMIGAKANNQSVSFDYQVKTGDIVEIITQKGKTHPKSSLLQCANSPSTKAKIERAIKQF